MAILVDKIRGDSSVDFRDQLNLHLQVKQVTLPRWYKRQLINNKSTRITKLRQRGIYSLPYSRKVVA